MARKGYFIYVGIVILLFNGCIPSLVVSSRVSEDEFADIKTINNIIFQNDSIWFKFVKWQNGGGYSVARNDELRVITLTTVHNLNKYIDSTEVSIIKEIISKWDIEKIFVRRDNTIFYVLKSSSNIPLVTSYNQSLVIQYCANSKLCPDCYPSCGKTIKIFEPNWYLIKTRNKQSWKPI